jgi:hypothetical protein
VFQLAQQRRRPAEAATTTAAAAAAAAAAACVAAAVVDGAVCQCAVILGACLQKEVAARFNVAHSRHCLCCTVQMA